MKKYNFIKNENDIVTFFINILLYTISIIILFIINNVITLRF